jgi:hypothetical protein
MLQEELKALGRNSKAHFKLAGRIFAGAGVVDESLAWDPFGASERIP